MGIDHSADTLKRMIQHVDTADFYLHVGDMSYADDRALVGPNPRYEEVWNQWQDSVAKVTARKPYMVVPGNHEKACVEADINCHSVHRDFLPYNTRFRMPWSESGGSSNTWYSFDVGLVHFTGINTETVFGGGNLTAQIEWLERDLAAAASRRNVHPWIIVLGHRPMYASSSSDSLNKLREAFESIFVKYKVDVFIAGHEHYFERMWPVNNHMVVQKNYERPTAPVHIVNGAAGCIESLSSYGTNDVPETTAFRNNEAYGFGWLEIFNRTTLKTNFVNAATDTVVDEIFIVRDDSDSVTIA
jgi:acid phosphatase type 7